MKCSVGGVLTMTSFERDYGYDPASKTRTNSLSVGLQQLGAFVGCFLAWPITSRFGRKKPLMLFSLVFCIGAAIQTIDTGSLTAFYIARVIAGLGLGSSTVVVPIFSSEMVPKELRGQIGSFFQLFFTFVSLTYGLPRDVLLTIGSGHLCIVLDRLRCILHGQRPDHAVADTDWTPDTSRRLSWSRCAHPQGKHALVD